jgi:hypothetical protein
MEIKHKDLVIDDNNPFVNCQLNRKQYAGILTSIVRNYADGFVLALNNEWGTGKTTFVRMWKRQLINDGYKTMYFNAWENDFEMEPLIAILGELKKLIGEKDNKGFKSLLKKGVIISKNVFPALAKAVASKYLDTDVTIDVIGKSIEAATEILDREVDEYVNKKQGLAEFKVELAKYIKANNNEKPVVFIIDELDRCRPDYAVEVLEKIKHFFSVEGIVFVLSIDKIQLGHSIQGFYGSDKIDTNEYLRRFIDIEYQLPAPDGEAYCKYLYSYYQFEEFFNLPERDNSNEIRGDGQSFVSFVSTLFNKHKYTLRQQEKLFAHSRLVLNTFSKKGYVFPELLFLLIHIRDFEIQFYNDIKTKKLTIQELVTKIESVFYIHLNNDEEEYPVFVHTETLFILFYYNYYFKGIYNHKYQLIDKIDETESLTFQSKTVIEGAENRILRLLSHFKNNLFTYDRMDLNYLLKKIDLLENIK